jgi:ribosome-binding factor A
MSRSEKVAQEIKREVGRMLQEDLRDPRLGFVTITRVELSDDLKFARIFFSVYGDASQWERTEEALNHALGFVRRLIGDRLGLRFVPDIAFYSDHSSEYSISIEQALQEVHRITKSEQPKPQRPKVKKTGVRHGAKTARSRAAREKK